MRKVALCGLIFVICLLTVGGQVYVKRGNLWAMSLEKNVESSLMLFRDGTVLMVTEYLPNRVTLPWGYVFKGRSPKDLLIVIHNHVGLGRWSDADMSIYHRLRAGGFAGKFLLCLGNGSVVDMED
jgi:hypothetical protein